MKIMTTEAEQYRNAYYTLSTLVKTVESINLERDYHIIHPPVDYDTYISVVSEAQSLLANFTGSVWSDLKSLPATIALDSQTVTGYFKTACSYLQLMQEGTCNPMLFYSLKSTMTSLLVSIGREELAIKKLQAGMKQCNGDFKRMGQLLQQVAAMAVNDREADLELVEELYGAISDMKSELYQVSQKLTRDAARAAAGSYMALVGISLPGRGGLLVLLIGGIMALTAASQVALDTVRMTSLQQRIDVASESADEYTMDAAQLLSIADDFTVYAQNAETMRKCLEQMHDTWRKLYDQLDQITQRLEEIYILQYVPASVLSALIGLSWEQIAAEIKMLAQDYRMFVSEVSELDVSCLSGKNVTLQVGMSQAEVSEALAAAKPVELIEYLTIPA